MRQDLLDFPFALCYHTFMKTVTVTCCICGESFERKRSHYEQTLKRNGDFYCTRTCYHLSRKRRETRPCSECGGSVTRRPSEFGETYCFCNKSCAAAFNNRLYPKRERREMVVCEKCGGKKARESVLCGDCRKRERSVERSQLTISGIMSQYDRWQRSNAYRRIGKYARHYNAKPDACTNCGWPHSLVWHHIVPVSRFPDTATVGEINAPDNLMCLCGNCHGYIHKTGKLPKILSYTFIHE